MENKRILTWNINYCEVCEFEEDKKIDNHQLIADEIMSHKADILCLQEVPEPNEFLKLFKDSYVPVGTPSESHHGYSCILVSHRVYATSKKINEKVCSSAGIVIIDIDGVQYGSCHLPSGKNNTKRLNRLKKLDEVCRAPCFISGDFNIRAKESIHSFIDTGSEFLGQMNPYPWNTFRNPFRKTTASSFKYRCRYDRILFKVPSELNMLIESFGLMGDKKIKGKSFNYLSDHFGLISEFSFNNEPTERKEGDDGDDSYSDY